MLFFAEQWAQRTYTRPVWRTECTSNVDIIRFFGQYMVGGRPHRMGSY